MTSIPTLLSSSASSRHSPCASPCASPKLLRLPGAVFLAMALLPVSSIVLAQESQPGKTAPKTAPKSSQGKNQGKNQPKKPRESWQPFDLAILFPLDSSVPVAKSGLCNAPTLDMLTVAGKPLLPRRYFNRIVDEAFGLESYVAQPNYVNAPAKIAVPPFQLNAGAEPAKPNQPQGPDLAIKRRQFAKVVNAELGAQTRAEQLAAIRSAFADGESASADQAAPLFCGRAPNASGIAKASDAVILDAGAHLAQLRRYPAALCDYENWRVTAVSFDLCLEQPEVAGIDTGTQTGMLPPECLTQEFRVTIKPVFSSAQRVKMVNAAIKLVFYLGPGGDDSLVAALKTLRTLTRIAAPGKEVNDGALKPHPGLVDEMARCDGAVAASVRRVIGYHGLARNLVAAQYSGFNRDLNRVSMGVVPFYQARQESTMNLDVVSSFSLRHLHPGVDLKPYSANIQPSHHQVVQGFAKPFRNAKQKLTDPAALTIGRDLVAKGNKIANPRLISQFPLNPVTHGTDCLSCHVTKAAMASIKASAAKVEQVASNAFRYYGKGGRPVKPWPGAMAKTAAQIENLGYFYDPVDGIIRYTIAERSRNEADNQCRLLASYY